MNAAARRVRSGLKPAALRLPPLARLVRQRDALQRSLNREQRRSAGLTDERDRLTRESAQLRDTLTSAVDRNDQLLRQLEAAHDLSGVGQRSYDWLFIVTYGRSGSTLLQGLLGSIPGYLIRGENRKALYHLYRHQKACLSQRERAGSFGRALTPADPWYGMEDYPHDIALDILRSLVLRTLIRPRPDSRVVGFKEIRWAQTDLADYIAFIRLLFPGARFVFNSRRLEDVVQSGWWAERADALEHLQAVEQRHNDAAANLGSAAFKVEYDQYVEDPSSLAGLYEWLGEEFDDAAVRKVIATPHSY